MTEILQQTQEIAIKTDGRAHWLIVDGEQIRITRKDYLDLYAASDEEVDHMLAIMTGKIAVEVQSP